MKKLLISLSFSLPLFLAGCIPSVQYPVEKAIAQPEPAPIVRAPKVGQEWVYEVRNVFNQELVDVVTERVAEVGPQVRITRSGEKSGRLPDEIQAPWGYILQDPHWSPPQKFEQVLPLWPEQLNTHWSGFHRTRYQVLRYPDSSYYWGLNTTAQSWESLAVPAGQFVALKYINEAPYFESNDPFRVASYRQEEVWLVPEVGRWIIRRNYGRYVTPGMVWGNAYWEDYLEWKLISWK